jgi:hypothetical protein
MFQALYWVLKTKMIQVAKFLLYSSLVKVELVLLKGT